MYDRFTFKTGPRRSAAPDGQRSTGWTRAELDPTLSCRSRFSEPARRPSLSSTRFASMKPPFVTSRTLPAADGQTTALRRIASRYHIALSFGMRCCVLKST